MALTDSEKERTRYHLGYPSINSTTMVNLGIPIPFQVAFVIDSALEGLQPAAEPRVRRLLSRLDSLEEKLEEAQDYLAAAAIDGLTLRPTTTDGQSHPDALEREYTRWAKRLADVLGAPLYPGSSRFSSGSRNINARVRN